MPFEAVTNLASVQAAEEERKRRAEQQQLELETSGLKEQIAERLALDAEGPAGQYDRLKGSSRVAFSPEFTKAAEEDRFLNQQAGRRFDRQQDALQRRSADLAIPGPSAEQRAIAMAAPLGRFATEDDSSRSRELATNPRGRLADIDRTIAELQHGVSRETGPILTDAPNAQPRDDAGTMPYAGALDDLLGVEVPRAGIRREFGGTAPDEVLSFSDRGGPGMRPYQSRGGTTRDVGAPGGGLVAASTGREDDPRDALLAGLTELRGEAERAPKTEQELAGELVTAKPTWDAQAAELADPAQIEMALNQAVADGTLDPAIGDRLRRDYAGVARQIVKAEGEFVPELFRQMLSAGRPPAPGEAEARAQQPSPIPQAKAEEQAAVQGALQAPQDGPGSTRSPALATNGGTSPEALLAEIQQPRRRPEQRVAYGGSGGSVDIANPVEYDAPFIPEGMGGEPVPPWLAGVPEDLRLMLGGASFAAGGRESAAERRRRLARERG